MEIHVSCERAKSFLKDNIRIYICMYPKSRTHIDLAVTYFNEMFIFPAFMLLCEESHQQVNTVFITHKD
jgi:hypothetical protein